MNALNFMQKLVRFGERVNDVHSRLNPTTIRQRISPRTITELQRQVQFAHATRQQLSIAGKRHAMGGQQFLSDGVLLDMTECNQVIDFDYERGLIHVQAGIVWPDLIAYLRRNQSGRKHQWTIAQKQTGADQLSIGGALSANIHGRGLCRAPIVGDVESFSLIQPDGQVVQCSRNENPQLFSLAIGGYGLFGVFSSVALRLVPRTILRRTVQLERAESVIDRLHERIAAGATFGDFQFAIDDKSSDFLNLGILSTYAPIDAADSIDEGKFVGNKILSTANWQELIHLAHADKQSAFDKYCRHYLATDGQLYSSDVFQLATYLEGYHERFLDQDTNSGHGSEVISELYVPRDKLAEFLRQAADLLRERRANVIYGTVRLIEQDCVSFLPWASQDWACIVLNLHVNHSVPELDRNRQVFRDLIDLARKQSGSYYLTYHKFATGEQLLGCYPQFRRFLDLKREHDPRCILSSDWHRYAEQVIQEC